MTNQTFAGTSPADGKTANLIYILYLVALVIGLTGLVGLIMAYINRSDAPPWVQSHYQFQIRTFWIGLLYGVVGLVTSLILIGWLILLATAVWWIVRCVMGMKALGENRPIANPTTWLW